MFGLRRGREAARTAPAVSVLDRPAPGTALLTTTVLDAPAPEPGEFTILVVDDDRLVGSSLRDLFTDFGHTVVGLASSGMQALVLVKTLDPDVVVTDLRMPGMSGVELCRRLSELPVPPGVVMVSAYDDASLQHEAQTCGASAYVIKGGAGDELHRAVLHAAAQRGTRGAPG